MAKQARDDYDFVLPHIPLLMEDWCMSRDLANKKFGWGFTPQKLGQLFTSGDYFPMREINMIYRDLRQWGKDHNLEGWEQIPND